MILTTKLSNMTLDNPIMAASGTFGYGIEFSQFYDINKLGTFSIKGTTLEPRFGNPTPRISETKNGMINAIGLQNPGVDKVISEEFPNLKKVFDKKIIANVGGSCKEDYVECARRLSIENIVGIIELNVSCPNVSQGGIQFGSNVEILKDLVESVKKVINKPLYVKLTPNVTNIIEIAKVCEDAGADGLVMINTLLGMKIDIKTGKPVIANKVGGYSGPGIFPVALRMIYQVYNAVNIPIIGVGGITNAKDVIEMMMAGATAVQVGSENLINPFVCSQIIDDLPIELEKLGVNDIKSIIGRAHE